MKNIYETLSNFKPIIDNAEESDFEKIGNLILNLIFTDYRFFVGKVKDKNDFPSNFCELMRDEFTGIITIDKETGKKGFGINLIDRNKKQELCHSGYTRIVFYNKNYTVQKGDNYNHMSNNELYHRRIYSLLKYAKT